LPSGGILRSKLIIAQNDAVMQFMLAAYDRC
jgi:hypothetical protein